MGCSASRPETSLLSSSNIVTDVSSPSSKPPKPVSRASSLPTHLVHHPPLKKGDTHHLVSLTSTTYGSLLLIDSNPNPNSNSNPNSNPQDIPSVSTNHNSKEYPSPDSVINTWELMAGLDEEFFDNPTSSKPLFSDRRCFSFDSSSKKSHLDPRKVNKSVEIDSFQSIKLSGVDEFEEEVPKENSTKPLWQHLSEELILADMDPNVVSSFRKAESSRKLGFNQIQFKKTDSSLLDAKLSHSPSPAPKVELELPGTEDRIVIYFTSLRGIRRTYEDCCVVNTIFKGLRVQVDLRDISMDSAYRKELQTALDKTSVSLPQVFIKGRYLGGVEEIRQLHEDGELAKLVEGFPIQEPGFVCENCGDARFVPCLNCNGSRKYFEEEEGRLKRCPECNENGLIRCPTCCS